MSQRFDIQYMEFRESADWKTKLHIGDVRETVLGCSAFVEEIAWW